MSETLSKCERDVRDDFERRWAAASPYRTVEQSRRYGNRPVPCGCGGEGCCGWRMEADLETLTHYVMEAMSEAAYAASREMAARSERRMLDAILGDKP